MSLLKEIQDLAIDSKIPLPNLLRKCKVLSFRLGSKEFGAWVDLELSGYKKIDTLPSYRVIKVSSKGNFMGPGGSGLKNADIPLSNIHEKFRKDLSYTYIMQPVASIESLVISGENHAIEPWNPDLVKSVSENIYKFMNCVQAWKVIPINSLIGVLDEIRNKILNFALEIESVNPDIGETPLSSSSSSSTERLANNFITNIYGNGHNIATGSQNFSQQSNNSELNAELFNSLLDAVKTIKDDKDHTINKVLSENIEEMRKSQGTTRFKEHYQKFMGLLADHIQVYQAVAPHLQTLATLIS